MDQTGLVPCRYGIYSSLLFLLHIRFLEPSWSLWGGHHLRFATLLHWTPFLCLFKGPKWPSGKRSSLPGPNEGGSHYSKNINTRSRAALWSNGDASFSVWILSGFMLWWFQGDLQMVISGANYRSDSWTFSLFNLIAALKRCLADWSVTVTGKECLRGFLDFVCLAVDMHKTTRYKRKTGEKKKQPWSLSYSGSLPSSHNWNETFQIPLSQFSLFPSISDCVWWGPLQVSPFILETADRTLPWKILRQMGDCPPFQSFPEK